MRAIVQRVRRGKVSVEGRIIGEIHKGLVILLGVGHNDSITQADYLAEKIATLRIFEDEQEKMNLSLLDIKGSALVVSQFTLYADVSRGRRPSFIDAALPDAALPLVDRFAEQLSLMGVPVERGQFGAHMLVEIENDGPVTIFLER